MAPSHDATYHGLVRVSPPCRRLQFGIKGGVENAFMSTTLESHVAMGYARGDSSRMGIVIEVQQGMISRGADISWLSQVRAPP